MDSILTHALGAFNSLQSVAGYALPFLIVLGIVVFVHEFGHFWIARRAGVKIEAFSIGFGPEIYGWYDKYGTRWKLAWLPLGGYVQMFGDSDPSSFKSEEGAKEYSEAEKKVAFFSQPLYKRAAIVAAGPGSNYLFAIVLLALLYTFVGQTYTDTTVSKVIDDSPAKEVGILAGDKIMEVDGEKTESLEDVRRIVSFNSGTPLPLVVKRGEETLRLTLTPKLVHITDRFGSEHVRGQIGIMSESVGTRDLGLLEAFPQAVGEVWNISVGTLKGVWQIFLGVRGAEELGGPLRIAEMSGKVAQEGATSFVWFLVLISVNLGLINLFPIPLLDGGHLVFYLFEGLRGKPLGERAQEYGMRFGALVVFSLMVFATWNDIVRLADQYLTP